MEKAFVSIMFSDAAEGVLLGFEKQLPGDLGAFKKRAICHAFERNRKCALGEQCPLRHVRAVEACRHWLRGLCANGDRCEYLHEYDSRFVSGCAYYRENEECSNPECPFMHQSALDGQPECAAYRRGFCAEGPRCATRHIPREACPFYLLGFCPLGPQCQKAHPTQTLYDMETVRERIRAQLIREKGEDVTFKRHSTCFKCWDPGHLAPDCPGRHYSLLRQQLSQLHEPGEPQLTSHMCFHCRREGHEASACPLKRAAAAGAGGGGRGEGPREGLRRPRYE